MKISYFDYLLTIFLKKLYGASNKFHFPKTLRQFFYKLHFKMMQRDLLPYFYIILNKINNPSFKGIHNKRIIWVFWWQGETNLPLIAKRCINSIIKHSSDHQVIFINRNNIRKFTNIPSYIYRKLKLGVIDFTHFSDIVRFNLLKRHGGLWIDSTMYCSRNLGPEYFNNYLYTSGGYHGTIPLFVKGRWIEGLIGGNKDNKMFEFMDKFNKLYWKNNNHIINYFMEDYAFEFIYSKNIGHFRTYVNNFALGNNPYLFKFINMLNKPYNSRSYYYITKNTSLFNLTYKKKFVDNGKTFYSKIMGHIN